MQVLKSFERPGRRELKGLRTYGQGQCIFATPTEAVEAASAFEFS